MSATGTIAKTTATKVAKVAPAASAAAVAAAAATETSNAASTTAAPTTTIKKKVLSATDYDRICEFIQRYKGLAIDCELEMVRRQFVDVERLTLKSILQTELGTRLRKQFWRYEDKETRKRYLRLFEQQSSSSSSSSSSSAGAAFTNTTVILGIAVSEGMSPVTLCRAILQEKYRFENKSQLARLMKYPHLIEDARLSANVIQCLCSDTQDGPLIDLRRRVIGEEYEVKLKQLAQDANMHYYDENDLRRMGYDKTPDIKMILPFLYNGEVVNWIESKAIFGDVKTHKYYTQQQLNSYCNRFGPGIVIYWFGYHEETARLTDNDVGITVLHDFPAADQMEFLNFVDSSCEDIAPPLRTRALNSPGAESSSSSSS